MADKYINKISINGETVPIRSDGASVTGVKGAKETSYRTGNVNLTPANIGALSTTGGTVNGDVKVVGKTQLESINYKRPQIILDSSGWYYCFDGEQGNIGNSIIFHLDRLFNNNNNECYTFLIEMAFERPSITLLSSSVNEQFIDKIRVRYNRNNKIKIDFHLLASSNSIQLKPNAFFCYGSGRGDFLAPTLVTEEDEEGYSFKEFNIIKNVIKSDNSFHAIDTHALLGTASADSTVQALIDAIADRVMTKLLAKTDILNTLTSTATDKPLSANMGRKLNGKLDGCLLKNGGTQIFNPVSNLNDFYTGIGLFNADALNLPTSSDTWYIVISAGLEGTVAQRAYGLMYGDSFFRKCTAGNWLTWDNKNFATESYVDSRLGGIKKVFLEIKSLTFTNGAAECTINVNDTGYAMFVGVCADGTYYTLACSLINATLPNVMIHIKCVDTPSLSGTVTAKILIITSV